jgi:hypothetical protein
LRFIRDPHTLAWVRSSDHSKSLLKGKHLAMVGLGVTWRGMMMLGVVMAATVRGESLFYREGGLPAEHLRALGLSSHEYCSGELSPFLRRIETTHMDA